MGTPTVKRIIKIQCDTPRNACLSEMPLCPEASGRGFPEKMSLELRLRGQRRRKGYAGRGSSICKAVDGA